MAYPDTDGTYGDLHLKDGRWLILHAPVGSGLPAKWVDDASVNTFMRDIGARRVSGSGDNMKIYAGSGDDSLVLDLGQQQDLDAFANLYRGVEGFTEGVGPRDVATSAYQQGAPVDLHQLWKDIYGDIPFPDVYATGELGQLIKAPESTPDNPKYVTDVSKYNAIIDALEARVGSLSRYGLDKDADYQVVNLGDEYESDIVISNGKVTKINKTTGTQAPAYTPGLRTDISEQMPGYDVLQQPTGQLSTVQQRIDPGYIIDPQTMQPYFQQPDGSLQAAPVPSVDDQISMHLVEGNMDAAVTKANFRDRPSSLEYFNAAMEWARTPADIFTISAIVRGVIEPTPGPMGELRRVGAPPAWAYQAWVGLQNSMGIPVESMTSGPGAEPGSVNEMMVASSSALVPNNFIAANSSATTLDGGKTVNPAPIANIMGDTTVQALDDAGNVVGSMTADAANQFGFGYAGQDGPSDFATAMGSAGTSTEVMAETAIDDPRTGTSWNPAEFAAGGLDDRMNQIRTAGGVLQADGSYLGPNGERWDSAGFLIETPVETTAEPTTNITTDLTGPNQPIPQTGDALRQIRMDAGLDPDTGLPYEYGTDPDDMFVESEADRVARIGSGATLPTTRDTTPSWLTQTAGGDDYFVPQGAIGSASSFADAIGSRPYTEEQAMAAQFGPYAIDTLEEGGYGNEQDIYADWRSGMVDIPGEGLISKDYLSTPARWEDVISGNTGNRASDFTGQSSYAGAVMPDYSSQPLGPTKSQIAAAQPFDYGDEGGSLQRDIELERQRAADANQLAEEEANKRLAAEIIAEEATRREALLATEADIANQFVSATQERDPIPTPYGTSYGGDDDYIPVYDALDYGGGDDYVPEMITVPSPAAIPTAAVMPTPSQIPEPVINVSPQPSGPEPYSEAAFWSDYGEGAKGTRTDDRFTLVGEEGPELALFPRGTEIIPLNRPTKPKQRRRLRNQFSDAIDSFAFGGFSSGGPALVGEMGPELVDLPPGAQVMPAGITEMMTGRPTRAPRSLFRQAGMRAPSAQTIANLLPEEIEVYQEMGRLAGIPDKAFEREFRSMVPMGQGGTRQARFTPRGTGRTRYGSI